MYGLTLGKKPKKRKKGKKENQTSKQQKKKSRSERKGRKAISLPEVFFWFSFLPENPSFLSFIHSFIHSFPFFSFLLIPSPDIHSQNLTHTDLKPENILLYCCESLAGPDSVSRTLPDFLFHNLTQLFIISFFSNLTPLYARSLSLLLSPSLSLCRSPPPNRSSI
jgi:hypothetical protein